MCLSVCVGVCVCWRAVVVVVVAGVGGALHYGHKTLSDEWAERQQFALHRPGDRSGEGFVGGVRGG